jgi:hypothetical protein
MGKLSAEEQKLLDDLNAKANEEDPDDKFEIEIYDTSQGKGARIPFSHGKKWLFDTFGVGEDPTPKSEGEGKEGSGDGKQNVKTGYFGRQQGKTQQPGKAS